MSVNLREELQSAVSIVSPGSDLIARSRRAGQQRLRRRRRGTVVGVCAAMLAVTLGATLLPSSWTKPAPAVNDSANRFDDRFDDLDLYADSLRQSGDATVWTAREHLVKLCLQAAGIAYEASPYPGGPVAHTRYAYPAADAIRRLGYDAPGLATADYGSGMASPNPSGGTPVNVPDSQLKARDACNQQATVWLDQKPVDDLRNTIDQQNQTLMAQTLASAAYSEAQSAWAGCMSDAGHPFNSPAQARAYADTVRGLAAQPSSAAIDTAIADYTCEHEVRLLEVLHTRLAAAVADWISSHAQLLDQYESAIRTMNNKARTYFG